MHTNHYLTFNYINQSVAISIFLIQMLASSNLSQSHSCSPCPLFKNCKVIMVHRNWWRPCLELENLFCSGNALGFDPGCRVRGSDVAFSPYAQDNSLRAESLKRRTANMSYPYLYMMAAVNLLKKQWGLFWTDL